MASSRRHLAQSLRRSGPSWLSARFPISPLHVGSAGRPLGRVPSLQAPLGRLDRRPIISTSGGASPKFSLRSI
ncbi:unnamed protein product [Lampetra planeri]